MRTALLLALLTIPAAAQWQPQQSNTTASLRGLSVVNDKIVWASGTGGTYLRTLDGGAHWEAKTVAGAEQLDFRDVEAWDQDTAVLLSAGTGEKSRIYRTTDGGQNWKLELTNPDEKGFWDCMAFWDRNRGIFVGDSVDGVLVVMLTADGGQTWSRVPKETLPPALPGEGAFAASGTSVAVQGKLNAWIGTTKARVFRTTDGGKTWTVADTPMAKGSDSKGIFSVMFVGALGGVAVGGDYRNPADTAGAAARTVDGGKTWRLSEPGPNGFRSAVARWQQMGGRWSLVAIGPTGTDASEDGAKRWIPLGKDGGNAVGGAGLAIWAVGAKGFIARTEWLPVKTKKRQ